VLLWDLDPQGAATFLFRVKPKVRGGGKGLVRGRGELADFIKATNYPGLELMPADFSYRNMDRHLVRGGHDSGRLAEILAPARHEFDFVFVDCPPAITLTSENIFLAADVLLIPVVPTFLSWRAYERVRDWFARHPGFDVRLLPFFSMVDRRRRAHRDTMERVVRDHPEVLETCIGHSAVVERMARAREPLQVCAPGHPVAGAFTALWREVHGRIGAATREKAAFPVGFPPA
jgi:cellulose biosynthesis protein BcsQ